MNFILSPKNITVTISLYNKENSIINAVESVIHQTVFPLSIIIVDDGSTDSGPEIVKSLCNKYECIKLIQQENQGVSVARNRGVEEAETDLVCFLDADDVWHPTYIENLIELYKEVGDADFYCLAYQMQSSIGLIKPKVALSENFKGIVSDPVKTYSRGYGLIHTSAVCVRKTFFYQVGGFPVGENFGEDLYFWLIAGLKGRVAFINKISVTLHKEPVNSIKRREHHPFHVSYFVQNMDTFSREDQKSLKEFLIKNIYLQWAAAKIENNAVQQRILRKYCFKMSYFSGLLLLIAHLLPSEVFSFLKEKRKARRLIEKN